MAAPHAALHVGRVPARRAGSSQNPAQERSRRLTPRVIALAVIAGIVIVGSFIGFLARFRRTMDRRRSGLRAGAGLAVNGRRDLHNLYLPRRLWLGVFSRRSYPLQPWASTFDIRHIVLHSSANLGSGSQAQASNPS